MSQQDITTKVDKAVFETITSLIPVYFSIVKALLFIVALVFSLVIVGVMVAGKVLLSTIQLVSFIVAQSNRKRVGVSA